MIEIKPSSLENQPSLGDFAKMTQAVEKKAQVLCGFPLDIVLFPVNSLLCLARNRVPRRFRNIEVGLLCLHVIVIWRLKLYEKVFPKRFWGIRTFGKTGDGACECFFVVPGYPVIPLPVSRFSQDNGSFAGTVPAKIER